MTGSSIVDEVVASAAGCDDPRFRTVFESLVRHLHAFVAEVGLTHEEWLAGIRFLTETGRRCDAYRQEFILLSDTLGVTALVDDLAARTGAAGGATESSVLGPFYVDDAPEFERGATIATSSDGIPLAVDGRVLDAAGGGVPNAVVDIWGTDGRGLYDSQYPDHPVECRGRFRTAADGSFAFRTVLPQSYPVPTDGPVGTLLDRLGRHAYRPAHLHVRISAPGFRTLTTAIYAAGDPYLSSDAVFGVRASLIEEFRIVRDEAGAPSATLHRDFVLAPAR